MIWQVMSGSGAGMKHLLDISFAAVDGMMQVIYIHDLSQLPSFDRSPKNGFRCVQYIDKEKIPESAFQPIEYSEGRDFSKEKPVPDNIFTIYKNQFLYDRTDLKSQ